MSRPNIPALQLIAALEVVADVADRYGVLDFQRATPAEQERLGGQIDTLTSYLYEVRKTLNYHPPYTTRPAERRQE